MDTINPQISVLDEFKLRDELRAMRAQIPDSPGLNPIVNLAFDLSRSLESGKINFEDLKALAGRLMDRACVRRAERLREQIGYVDNQTTIKRVLQLRRQDRRQRSRRRQGFRRIQGALGPCAQWHRVHRTSDLRPVRSAKPSNGRNRRPAKSKAIRSSVCRTALTARLRSTTSTGRAGLHPESAQCLRRAAGRLLLRRRRRIRRKAYKFRPKIATIASWVGYDLDGRTDIKWPHSFVLRLQEKVAALPDIRDALYCLEAPPARRRRSAAHCSPDHRQAGSRDRRGSKAARQPRTPPSTAKTGCLTPPTSSPRPTPTISRLPPRFWPSSTSSSMPFRNRNRSVNSPRYRASSTRRASARRTSMCASTPCS